MNIYEKLAEARITFQNKNIKKSGENKGMHFKYFELDDILPVINVICKELKILTTFYADKDIAKLEVIDAEKPEDLLVFTLPMSSASLKCAHEVQNLGAVQTYLKRYLYQNAFEIAEGDALDASMGNQETTSNSSRNTGPMGGPDTPEENKAIRELLSRKLANGSPAFTRADCDNVGRLRNDHTAKEVIAILTKQFEDKEIDIRTQAVNNMLDQASEIFDNANS